MALRALTDDLFGEVTGDSPRVLALHGWGRDRTNFAEVLDGIDAVALDLPGFGASPAPPDGWGAREYATAVAPVLDQFPAPPVVVGHSFGGRVGVCLAADGHPMAGLVLAGVPLLRRQSTAKPKPMYRFIRWAAGVGLIGDERLEAARRKYGSADYRAAEGVMRDVLVRVVNETYEDELRKVKIPVRLLWGRDDNAAGAWIVEEALDLLDTDAGATLVDGGHDVVFEQPDLLRHVITELEALRG
ncbi:MAG: alpha/beta hydrolase [Acidimicrobiia bacterium]|nr:MAG: alpha/beta hydrolase [Acidimicrobiia bacterium]